MATTPIKATPVAKPHSVEPSPSERRTLGGDETATTGFGESIGNTSYALEGQQARLALLRRATGAGLESLEHSRPIDDPSTLRGNIENFIGLTQVPTGVIGPVAILGTAARGGYYVPLATTEGALVASFNRGAKATREAGGITSVCLQEGVQRAPVFKFNDIHAAQRFADWVTYQQPEFDALVAKRSRHAKLLSVRSSLEGNQVTVIFEYHTGDAAGQNMVTLCTDSICDFILSESPERPASHFIEGNYSGDKKATASSFAGVRGKRVSAEVNLPREVVTDVLQTTPEALREYWQTAALGTAQSGAIGLQGHFANGLTALYLACGQDVACVAESYAGFTRFEPTQEGGLYASVTLPSLIVGTVGGGTHLPTQAACLELLGCTGTGTARKFAEICAAVVLCGELSISAAIASGDFARAHQVFGRRKI